MNKLFLSLVLSCSLSFASVVNGIAITVNDDPITLYDIEKTSAQNNVDKNQALSVLIDEILYKQLVKKYNINADVFAVNEYIEKLAGLNNMDVYTFKSLVKQKYSNYSQFEEEAKKAVTREKLIEKIVKGNLKIATEEDMKLYYENNKELFTTADSFEVIKYSTKNKPALIRNLKNPMITYEGVSKESEVLNANEMNGKLIYILTETKKNTFTPIFTYEKKYTSFYLNRKIGENLLSYDIVKGKIFNNIMKTREAKYLKEYFEKEKLTADIKIIR